MRMVRWCEVKMLWMAAQSHAMLEVYICPLLEPVARRGSDRCLRVWRLRIVLRCSAFPDSCSCSLHTPYLRPWRAIPAPSTWSPKTMHKCPETDA